MRGFASIGLWRPKCDGNIGGALRAAYAFDARLVVLIGTRTLRWSRAGKIESTDTGAAAKHLPVITLDTLPDGLVFGTALVAVEVVPDGEQMPTFVHPESAFYLFGPEDGSLPKDIINRADHVVRIPCRYCLNLAASINVTLYDRAAKSRPMEQVERVARAITIAEPRAPDPDAPIYLGPTLASAWQGRVGMAHAAIRAVG